MKTSRPSIVVHIITELGSGGAERMLTRVVLAAHQRASCRQVVVSLMNEGIYGATLRDAGVELHCLRMRRGVPSLPALLTLVRVLRRHKPDVIMTWLYHADLLGLLASLLAGLGARRVVWNLRCSDFDSAVSAGSTRLVIRALTRLSALPAAVAANSWSGRRHHAMIGYRPQRWVILPNGFDPGEWRPDASDRRGVRRELGLAEHSTAIGMVARADPQKDHATFFAAAERLCADDRDLWFILIGRGTEDLTVPAALAGRMKVLGERQDIQRLLRGLDVFVLCSAYSEGFPNVIGEAMATGLPCVVTDVGDSRHVVGDSGLVVPRRDSDALAQALNTVIIEPIAKRCERGRRARERIERHYQQDAMVAGYVDLWRSMCGPHVAGRLQVHDK